MYFPTKTETKLSQGNLDFHYAQDLLFSKKNVMMEAIIGWYLCSRLKLGLYHI